MVQATGFDRGNNCPKGKESNKGASSVDECDSQELAEGILSCWNLESTLHMLEHWGRRGGG